MNLHQLRIFYTAARRRSFTAAAEDLYMTQPAISLQIRALERDLGIRLFERSASGLSLTQAGEALFRSAEAILNAEDEAQRMLAELRGASRGKLVVGANTTGGMYVVPPLIRAFHELHPKAEILLDIEYTDKICEKTAQSIIDFGFVGGPLEYHGITVEHLCPDEVVPIVAPGYPLCRQPVVTLDQLAEQPLILTEPGSRTRALVERSLRDLGMTMRPAMQLNGTEAIKKAVEATLGIGFVSRHAVAREVALGCLVVLRVEGLELRRHLELIYRTRKYLTPLAKEFLRFAREYAARALAGSPPIAAAAN